MDCNVFICYSFQYRTWVGDFSSISSTYCEFDFAGQSLPDMQILTTGSKVVFDIRYFSARISFDTKFSRSCRGSWITSS